MEKIDFDELLDAKGLLCPEPVMMLHSKIADIETGAVLKVEATDPSTQRDIAKFCQFLGHDLIDSVEVDKVFLFWIKKSEK